MTVSMLVKVQEEVAAGQKREVEEEDPYNQESMEQVGSPPVVQVLHRPPHLEQRGGGRMTSWAAPP